MSAQLVPPSLLTCHWYAGAGSPVATAVKLTLLPASTVWLAGFVVNAGGDCTVSVAISLVSVPVSFVATHWYFHPFISFVAAPVV